VPPYLGVAVAARAGDGQASKKNIDNKLNNQMLQMRTDQILLFIVAPLRLLFSLIIPITGNKVILIDKKIDKNPIQE
jgi:hypothetical protein